MLPLSLPRHLEVLLQGWLQRIAATHAPFAVVAVHQALAHPDLHTILPKINHDDEDFARVVVFYLLMRSLILIFK